MANISGYLGFLPRPAAFLCFALMIAGQSRADETRQILLILDRPEDAQKWRAVNDGVMGGRSEGTFRINRNGILEFYGNLSLENRGGFASVRLEPAKLGLSEQDALIIRFRGDGRTYICNLYVPTDRIAFSYRAEFGTEAGRWQEVRLPLKSFRATWFGKTLSNAPAIDARNIRSLGFMIADKKAGPFKLEIDWIATDRNVGPNP